MKQGLQFTTEKNSSRKTIKFNRYRAENFFNSGHCDNQGKYTIFSQAFRHLHSSRPTTLRHSNAYYKVDWLAEGSEDAGGPYNETYGYFGKEIESECLPLLMPSPCLREESGNGWVLNRNSTSSTHRELFAFFGKSIFRLLQLPPYC